MAADGLLRGGGMASVATDVALSSTLVAAQLLSRPRVAKLRALR